MCFKYEFIEMLVGVSAVLKCNYILFIIEASGLLTAISFLYSVFSSSIFQIMLSIH